MDGVCLACGSWSLEEWGPPSELDPLGWVDLVECISCGREAADTLYVVLRMGRVRGWARLVVAWSMRRGTFVGVELAAGASEEDARTWASLFGARYRWSRA